MPLHKTQSAAGRTGRIGGAMAVVQLSQAERLEDSGMAAAHEKWPVDAPCDWPAWVNQAATAAELKEWPTCVKRSRPYGDQPWQEQTTE